jgi:hypothetical protein
VRPLTIQAGYGVQQGLLRRQCPLQPSGKRRAVSGPEWYVYVSTERSHGCAVDSRREGERAAEVMCVYACVPPASSAERSSAQVAVWGCASPGVGSIVRTPGEGEAVQLSCCRAYLGHHLAAGS